ncbi:hypothetical protein GEMRC1_010887 [Eukaryota sp. GEM-RC1]
MLHHQLIIKEIDNLFNTILIDMKSFGAVLPVLPSPVCIIALDQGQGKPTFTPIAFAACCNMSPALITLGVNLNHFLNSKLKEDGICAIGIPTTEMYKRVDACGQISARKGDKSDRFLTEIKEFDGKDVFIMPECPMNIVAKVVSHTDHKTNTLFVLEVLEVLANENILVDGKPDLGTADPLLFSFDGPNYYKLGEKMPLKPWEAGRGL